MLLLQIEAQDGAAHTDVGTVVDQFVAAHPEPLGPEGHDLHQTHRPGIGDGPAIETAFDVNDCKHQPRGQWRHASAMGLAVDRGEDVEALGVVLDPGPQPRLHEFVPDGRVKAVRETLGLCNGRRHHFAQARVELLVGLRPRSCEPGQQAEQGAQEQSQAWFQVWHGSGDLTV